MASSATLTAVPRNAAGDPLTGVTISWVSSNPAIATVASSGLYTGDVVAVAAGSCNVWATDGAVLSNLVPVVVT